MSTENDTKHNSSWIKAAKDRGRWIILENDSQRQQKKDLRTMCYAKETLKADSKIRERSEIERR